MRWKWTHRKTPLFFVISTENSSDYKLLQCKMQGRLNLKHYEQTGGKHLFKKMSSFVLQSDGVMKKKPYVFLLRLFHYKEQVKPCSESVVF